MRKRTLGRWATRLVVLGALGAGALAMAGVLTGGNTAHALADFTWSMASLTGLGN
jgi:hypothetical protein